MCLLRHTQKGNSKYRSGLGVGEENKTHHDSKAKNREWVKHPSSAEIKSWVLDKKHLTLSTFQQWHLSQFHGISASG